MNSAGLRRHRLPPLAASHAAIRPGMSSGGRNTGSSGSMTNRSGELPSRPRAAATRDRVGAASPSAARHSCSSHRPADVAQVPDGPVDPASLVKFAPPGSPRSPPAGQVPSRRGTRCRTRYRRSSRWPPAPRPPPTPCHATPTAISGGASPSPDDLHRRHLKVIDRPDHVPRLSQRREAATRGQSRRAPSGVPGRPRPRGHVEQRRSSDALVTSAAPTPVSQYASRSGSGAVCARRRSTRESRPPPRRWIQRVERQVLNPGRRVQLA